MKKYTAYHYILEISISSMPKVKKDKATPTNFEFHPIQREKENKTEYQKDVNY